MSRDLRQKIHDGRVHVLDGAMGTLFYARGYFVNVCYEDLSRAEPGLVEATHREYLGAGATILETNTFGANPVKLSGFGLENDTELINRASAEAARRAAGDRASVLGAMGPLGTRLEPWGATSAEEARDYFSRQVAGLLDGDVDGFILETHGDLNEIRQAIAAVRARSDLPVMAQMTVGEDGKTQYGAEPEQITEALTEAGADVVGLNCSVGPAGILEAIERMARTTDVPLVAQPNAGLPRRVGDRTMYLASPEYMGQYARRLLDAGARFIGGCCGTTPEHTRRIRTAVEDHGADGGVAAPPAPAGEDSHGAEAEEAVGALGSESGRTAGFDTDESAIPVAISGDEAARQVEDAGERTVPLNERSRWGRKLASGELVTSVELAPPRGWDPEPMVAGTRELAQAGVDSVAVLDAPRDRARMGVLPASMLLAQEPDIEPLVCYTCRDRTMPAMISDLLGAAAGGIRNLLLVSGNPAPQGVHPDGRVSFDIDSVGLTNVVRLLNGGLDPAGNATDRPTEFVVGVALSQGSSDREQERERFRLKLEAGADFAVTQPVFDPSALQEFLDDLGDPGVPVVAGLWPPASLRNAEFLANEVPGVRVPTSALRAMEEAQLEGPEAAARQGVRLAVEAFEGIRDRVAGAHLSVPAGRTDLALQVLSEVGLIGEETGARV